MRVRAVLPSAWVLLGLSPLPAQEARPPLPAPAEDKSLKDLMDLMNTRVVSASKTLEKI